MNILKFEDRIAWQKARDLTKDTYSAFKTCKDFSFRDQVQRAAVSIMNNIAEAFGRNTDKEFRSFLYISRGSCAEAKSMFYLAYDLGYINREQFSVFASKAEEIARVLTSFIKKLQTKD